MLRFVSKCWADKQAANQIRSGNKNMSARMPVNLNAGLPLTDKDLARVLREQRALQLQAQADATYGALGLGDGRGKAINNSGFGAFDPLAPSQPRAVAEFLAALSETPDWKAVKRLGRWACGSWERARQVCDALLERMAQDPVQNTQGSACNQTLIRIALRYPEKVIACYGKGLEKDEAGLALDECLLAPAPQVDGEHLRPADPRYDLLRVARIVREVEAVAEKRSQRSLPVRRVVVDSAEVSCMREACQQRRQGAGEDSTGVVASLFDSQPNGAGGYLRAALKVIREQQQGAAGISV